MSRHVGGSLLPSNSKEVLKLRESTLGDLQVRVLESADTHALFYRAIGAETFRMIASHPNGFSCAELADRMIHAWTMPLTESRCARVLAQFDYILDCGGLCMKRSAFEELVRADRTALD
jgi:hypothetical protein